MSMVFNPELDLTPGSTIDLMLEYRRDDAMAELRNEWIRGGMNSGQMANLPLCHFIVARSPHLFGVTTAQQAMRNRSAMWRGLKGAHVLSRAALMHQQPEFRLRPFDMYGHDTARYRYLLDQVTQYAGESVIAREVVDESYGIIEPTGRNELYTRFGLWTGLLLADRGEKWRELQNQVHCYRREVQKAEAEARQRQIAEDAIETAVMSFGTQIDEAEILGKIEDDLNFDNL